MLEIVGRYTRTNSKCESVWHFDVEVSPFSSLCHFTDLLLHVLCPQTWFNFYQTYMTLPFRQETTRLSHPRNENRQVKTQMSQIKSSLKTRIRAHEPLNKTTLYVNTAPKYTKTNSDTDDSGQTHRHLIRDG